MCDYADMALQKIKGKAYAIYEFYDDKMRKEMMREKRIENNVAMALRDEEFKVYIQPKVDMRSGEIIGGEALIRGIVSKKALFILMNLFQCWKRAAISWMLMHMYGRRYSQPFISGRPVELRRCRFL